MPAVTRILEQIESGDASATDELLPLVYDELRQLAAAKLAHEKPGHTLQATALVHEAWMRLAGHAPTAGWQGRRHFIVAAAEAMRRILVDSARRKSASKRGGAPTRQVLDEAALAGDMPSDEVLAVHAALDSLAVEQPVAANLVKLHYFSGFSLEESADLLDVSRATAYRLWTFSRAWLRSEIAGER